MKENWRIYEAHIGMCTEEDKVATYQDFRQLILPKAKELGFNAIQLMGIYEHPYYGSIGYQISNLFAPSSRFGTPDDLKELIDEAHGMGLHVLLDTQISHFSKNSQDGIADMNGKWSQYQYPGERGDQKEWDVYNFDKTKLEVIRFLLSSLHYYWNEFKFDGFRVDAVTSQLYKHHGIDRGFGGYHDYFNHDLDIDGLAFLKLAIMCMKAFDKNVVFMAEDVSGFPALCWSLEQGGIGFDYTHGMYEPELARIVAREYRNQHRVSSVKKLIDGLIHKKTGEKYIAYTESHD